MTAVEGEEAGRICLSGGEASNAVDGFWASGMAFKIGDGSFEAEDLSGKREVGVTD